MSKKRVLGVIGLGHVGAHVAYSLAVQGIADELVLVDKNEQKLASEERKLQTAYMEIGKLYYEKHEGEIDEEYIPLFEDVAAAAAAAADYKEQISKARNQVQCPCCGAYQSADSAFCNKCGASLKSDDDVEDM